MLFLLAATSSGCLTQRLWTRLSKPVQLTRPVGVVPAPDGGELAVFNVRRCPDVPDGLRAVRIPAGWRAMPVRPSQWGGDILEIDAPVEQSIPVAADVASSTALHPIGEKTFSAVRNHAAGIAIPGWRPIQGLSLIHI